MSERPSSSMLPFIAVGVSSIALALVVLMLVAYAGALDVNLGPLRLRSKVHRGAETIQRQEPAPDADVIDGAAVLSDGSSSSQSLSTRRVVLIIGDGLGLGGLSAASTSIHGPQGGLAVESLPVVGLVRTTAANNLITDSAAAGTAMSTGTKTNRGVIGQRPDGTQLRNLFEVARAASLATGVVTTSGIMDATPTTFTVHGPDRRERAELFAKILGSGCEVLVGAHWDLLDEPPVRQALELLRNRGVSIVDTEEALEGMTEPFIGLFGPRDGAAQAGGPPLDVSVRAALRVLSRDDDGFVLLVESEETDRVGHHNDSASLPAAVRELDAAVRVALDFANDNPDTLVIVTADHDTGAPAIVSGSPDAFAQAQLRWLVDTHTASWVPLFATGPGAERFAGVIDNTEIGLRLADLLELERPGSLLEERE